MLIIGEKLNSSVSEVYHSFQNRDAEYVKALALAQTACGADVLDLNAGLFPNEAEVLLWAVEQVRSVCETPLSLDSMNPAAIAAVLERFEPERVVINSITLVREHFEEVLALVKRHHTDVIALPVDENGVPKDAAARVENARKLLAALEASGIDKSRIYVDILVEAVSVNALGASAALEAAKLLRAEFADIHLIGGMSNVSHGLPGRGYVNAAFLTAAVQAGVDAMILDITNPDVTMSLLAAELVNGNDRNCTEYLAGYRRIFDNSHS